MIGKLLIVEDQTVFRKGLIKMIENHSLGWTVVGEAENGREAVKLLDELEPHLILTDIRMPLMDGIQLAEYVHERKRDIAVVILTGYEDFKYAQAALKYGAIDFLLKPCNEQVLIEVLSKAYDHFREAELAKERALADRRATEEHALRSLLLRLPCDERLVGRVRAEYADKRVRTIRVADYLPAGKQYRESDLELLQFALFNIVTELAGARSSGCRLVALEHDLFALLTDAGETEDGLSEAIRAAIRDYLGIDVEVDEGGSFGRLTPIVRPAVQTAAAGAPSAEATGGSAGLPHWASQAKIKELHTRLATGIVLGRLDQVTRDIETIVSGLAGSSVEDAKIDALTFAIALHQTANQLLAETGGAFDLSERIESLQAIAATEELVRWTREQADRFLHRFQTWQADKSKNIISKTIEWLDRHYMEPCGLTETAETFHMSGTYFSKLFKKETGETFTNYVTKVRMEKAKMMLCNTDMKVFEIAAAVGYDDPNYFTNVFNRTQNVSPTEFRKMCK
ncbi:response regulator [Paenibacillus flagellatus]|uniref:DNA-binding response regulator n=1 Tax=Paenibacillus flagellatus TaxID=2211139 RepID=A0A2V5K2Y3_9BACL|nr:response regulator [Paenibacillus flagellatus]PYI52164.1 DNA-binding response regulator [Paenibacillus flagellatus]